MKTASKAGHRWPAAPPESGPRRPARLRGRGGVPLGSERGCAGPGVGGARHRHAGTRRLRPRPGHSARWRRASPPSAASWTCCGQPGITGPNIPVRDYLVEAWRQVIDVNLNGSVLLQSGCLAAPGAQRLRPHRQHCICRRQGGQPERFAYSTSKAADPPSRLPRSWQRPRSG